MRAPAIVPTITQRVRLLLAEQGAALRPWAGLQETYDELYALLRRRRSEPEFWQPLKGLLQEVIASAADSQRSGRKGSKAAELLDSWQVDDLVDELRAALPDEGSGAWVSRTDFTRTLSTAVLGGFLLLGLAATGCGSDSSEGGTGGTGGSLGSGGHTTMTGGAYGTGGVTGGVGGVAGATLTGAGGSGGVGAGGARLDGSVDAAGGKGGGTATGGAGGGGAGGMDAARALDVGLDGAGGVRLDGFSGEAAVDGKDQSDAPAIDGNALACAQNVAPELDRAIGASSISAADKGKLCGCFSALDSGWTTSLADLFAKASPAEISTMLTGLLPCCSSASGIVGRNGPISTPSSSYLSEIKNGHGYMLCAAPTYKGVSFPE